MEKKLLELSMKKFTKNKTKRIDNRKSNLDKRR